MRTSLKLVRLIASVMAIGMLFSMFAPAAGAAPPPPDLTAPAHGSSVAGNPVFSWERVPGALRYRIQVAPNPEFSVLLYNVETHNNRATPPLALPTGTIYWKVAAIDTSQGAFSPTMQFTNSGLARPVLTTPADGAQLQFPDHPPLFSWEPIAGIKQYEIEIDDDSAFVNSTKIKTNNTYFADDDPQVAGQTYYWRVKGLSATAGSDTPVSETRSYQVVWGDASRPQLIGPPDDTANVIEDVVLRWEAVPGAADYQVQISPNGDWANNVTVDQVVDSTRFSPTPTLNNRSYFWRVRARDAKTPAPNLGTWSPEWQFTRGWPGRPVLLTPASGDQTVRTPNFSWSPVDHASHYEFQIGTDPNFSPNSFVQCLTNHTQFTPYELFTEEQAFGEAVPGACHNSLDRVLEDADMTLAIGTTYYWRVRGIDAPANVNGLWSDVSSLIHKPDVPQPLAPASGETVTSPVLRWERVPGVGKYQVIIRKANGLDAINPVLTYANSYTPTTALNPADGPFKWFVRTRDAEGRIGLTPHQSDWWTFSLAAPSPSSSTPDRISPADGVSSPHMPSLEWQPVTNATTYTVHYSVAGSGVVHPLGTTPFTSFTSIDLPLHPGAYEWWVEASLAGGGLSPPGTSGTFTVASLPGVVYDSPAKCTAEISCVAIGDTPTLKWDHVEGAGLYLVYLSKDANFTNLERVYKTQFPVLTPRDSLLDNQAGQAYYWFVRPCFAKKTNTTPLRCGRFDNGVFPDAFAFRKRSAPVELTAPADGASVGNQVVLEWRDYLQTNSELGNPVTQEAKLYRVQISTVPDFATILHQKEVDQSTYTRFDSTFPEGPLYWRVQAIDGSGNLLTSSETRTLTKASPALSPSYPHNDSIVNGVPYFRWDAQAFAKEYELEVYKNADLNFSLGNRVVLQKTKMAAWAPSVSLPAGAYAWRVRRIDGGGLFGPWSAGRTFTLARSAPAVLGPVDAQVSDGADLLYEWGAVPDAAQYKVEVATTAAFTSLYEAQPTVMTSWAPTKKYAEGTYFWRVRTVDAAGNVGAPSEVRRVVVDTSVPDTTIAPAPPANIKDTSITFSFTSNEPTATFECALDNGAFQACVSPKSYSGLSQGKHTFKVRAVDAAGHHDATPAQHLFNVRSIQFTKIVYKASTLNKEWVQIKNWASTPVDLQGFTIRDNDGNVFTFPTTTLGAGALLKLHSGSGTATATDRYWGRTTPVWDNVKDVAILKRPDGTKADRCAYDNGSASSKTC